MILGYASILIYYVFLLHLSFIFWMSNTVFWGIGAGMACPQVVSMESENFLKSNIGVFNFLTVSILSDHKNSQEFETFVLIIVLLKIT